MLTATVIKTGLQDYDLKAIDAAVRYYANHMVGKTTIEEDNEKLVITFVNDMYAAAGVQKLIFLGISFKYEDKR